MAIAIYGGTFDPFHLAHKNIVKSLLKSQKFSAVYVIPAGISPHKGDVEIQFSTYRYMMARLALAKYDDVIVSDYEIKKESISYSIDTIRYFYESVLEEDEEIYFVLGSDSLMQIETWYKPAEIMSEVILYVALRPGGERSVELERQQKHLENKYRARIQYFENKPMPISSTVIRNKIKAGDLESIEVPKKVKAFIMTHFLYQDSPIEIFSSEQINQLRKYERQLMHFMTPERLTHSLNVMYEAVRLARRFGVSPWSAAVAGILHDVAKEQDYKKFPSVLERLDEETLANKSIVHGPVGASFVRAYFHVEEPAILDAIYYHSTLSPVPTDLEKIVFLADKTEPGRDFTDLAEIRQMAQLDLNRAVLMTIDATAIVLKRNRKNLHSDTIKAKQYISRLDSEK